jgi:hypothetical protein
MIDSNTRETLKYSEWMERGFLPVAGGLLDQSASLMEYCRVYTEDKNRIEAERYKQ